MSTLPNVELSSNEITHLYELSFYNDLGGAESIVIPDKEHGVIHKIFKRNFGDFSMEPKEIETVRENKLAKLLWLHDHSIPNDISVLRTFSRDKKFVGYDMSWDLDDHTFASSLFTRTEMVEYLKRLRDKLYQFHELGIVHGDVKGENVLINYRTGHVNLCDLDNMQIGKHPIDLYNSFILPFQNLDYSVNEKVDTYMQNLLLLTEFDSCYDNPHEILHQLEYGYHPSYLAKSAGPILYKTMYLKPSPNEYLLDHLKKKV